MESFTLFPHLPLELRLKIWRSTLPGPRNVGVKIRFKDGRFGGWVARDCTPRPPMALQVCHESREEARKYYVLSFGTTLYPPTVYFNYKTDTLCFGDGMDLHGRASARTGSATGASDYLLNLWHGKTYNSFKNDTKAIQARSVRYIALDVDESIYSRPSFCWEEIRRFEGLQELLLITWDPDDRADELMAYFRIAMQAVAAVNPEWVVPRTKVVSASGREWGTLQLAQDVSV
jgi:hypothetical protein